jgi:hypothetical protein
LDVPCRTISTRARNGTFARTRKERPPSIVAFAGWREGMFRNFTRPNDIGMQCTVLILQSATAGQPALTCTQPSTRPMFAPPCVHDPSLASAIAESPWCRAARVVTTAFRQRHGWRYSVPEEGGHCCVIEFEPLVTANC